MSDLDIQLIREFALRPIIYNKSTPFFKNKYLTDCAWDEIATKVGVSDVNRVRDRINQLRNRYNLEKRKVDLQKAEGITNARSTWPLFNNFRFLDGHIRPRKSYKSLGRRPRPVGRPRRTHPYAEDSYAVFNDTAIQYTQQLQNTRIKTEPTLNHSEDTNVNNFHSEYESDVEADGDAICADYSRSDQKSNNSDGDNFINPAAFLVANEDSGAEQRPDGPRELNTLTTTNKSLTVRNFNSIANGRCTQSSASTNPPLAVDSESEGSIHNQSYRQNENSSAAKFEAFGKFLSSSLIDLPEPTALHLIEKFTIELVRAFSKKSADN